MNNSCASAFAVEIEFLFRFLFSLSHFLFLFPFLAARALQGNMTSVGDVVVLEGEGQLEHRLPQLGQRVRELGSLLRVLCPAHREQGKGV